MIKNAIAEIRLHPGRIIATLIAIAISIGFMAGQIVFVSNIKNAMEKSQNLQISKADISINAMVSEDQLKDSVTKQKGVTAAQATRRSSAVLKKDDKKLHLQLYSVPDDDFAWARPIKGRWPNAAAEMTLSPQAAAQIGVAVGDRVDRIGEEQKVTIVGITNDVNQPLLGSPIGYSAMFEEKQQEQEQQARIKEESGEDIAWTSMVVRIDPGASIADVRDELAAKIHSFDPSPSIRLVTEAQQESLKQLTGEFDVMKNILLVFGVISLIVGMIIIANTFNILVAQRRQQIGLLRAIGATGNQVRTQFLAEASIVGILGSAMGIALGVGLAAVGLWWIDAGARGLNLPSMDLALIFGLGVVTTVVSALLPSLRATRVSPMEALQVVPSEQRARRITRARYMVCAVLALIGGFLVYQALTVENTPLAWAVGAGAALSLAVLGGAPIFVPWLVRGLGRLLSGTGPTTRIATANSVRNPSRSAATATALMLATGLIVTLQVTVSTVRTTVVTVIANRYPVALSVDSFNDEGLPKVIVDKVRQVSGIAENAAIDGGFLGSDNFTGGQWTMALAPGDQLKVIAPQAKQPPPSDQEVYVNPSVFPKGYGGEPQTITGPNGSVALKLVASNFAGANSVIVSPASLRKLVADPVTSAMWLSATPSTSPAAVISQLIEAVTGSSGYPEAGLSGSLFQKYQIEQVVNIMLATISALLGVAVLIALIGVANTLGLSVIERGRESGLLRALGMQRSKLRLMLLIEALLIAGTGALVGIGAGAFFGWLGTYSVFRSVPDIEDAQLVYSVDWLYTAGLLLITVVAAALASILPGRRAANTTPMEALATD